MASRTIVSGFQAVKILPQTPSLGITDDDLFDADPIALLLSWNLPQALKISDCSTAQQDQLLADLNAAVFAHQGVTTRGTQVDKAQAW